MFGYVRPSLARLSHEDKDRFSAMYCGLCRTLGRRCGKAAPFILNYDFTFLAVLLAPAEPEAPLHRRCAIHPLRGRDYFPENAALELAADCSVILAWWQLRDAIQDEKGLEAKYRAAALALGPAYRRARQKRPEFDRSTRQHLAELSQLEEERCPSMDQAADTFARLLQSAAGEVNDTVKRRILEQVLYHLGRWIYLVDAADDLAKDFTSGSYNPLIYRYGLTEGKLTEDARESLVLSLDHSIRLMAAACELWDFGVWTPIIQATVYEGMFLVGQAVLEGTFQAADTLFSPGGRDEDKL